MEGETDQLLRLLRLYGGLQAGSVQVVVELFFVGTGWVGSTYGEKQRTLVQSLQERCGPVVFQGGSKCHTIAWYASKTVEAGTSLEVSVYAGRDVGGVRKSTLGCGQLPGLNAVGKTR